MQLKILLILICFIGALTLKGQEIDSSAHFIIEKMPLYGGNTTSDLRKEIARCFIYPHNAYSQNIEGRVILRFTVDVYRDKGKKVYNIHIVKGIDVSLDFAAIAIIEMLPDRWKPGSSRGRDEPITFTYCINFKKDEVDVKNISKILDPAIEDISQLDSASLNSMLYGRFLSESNRNLTHKYRLREELQDFIDSKSN